MEDVFKEADFSGIDGTLELFMQEVCHTAFVTVDEEGSESTAANAVVMERKGEVSVEQVVKLDRPFIFLIRDFETSTVLFMGQVVSPAIL